MGLTIAEIRNNCVKARHLMRRSRDQHFAVGAFNIDNQETLIAICRAAQAKNAPVLVEVSDGEVKAIGLENIRDLVDNYKAEYGVEMYLNLDHSPTVEDCKRAIDAGYEFIHIDISQANHEATEEEIIEKARSLIGLEEVLEDIVDIAVDFEDEAGLKHAYVVSFKRDPFAVEWRVFDVTEVSKA